MAGAFMVFRGALLAAHEVSRFDLMKGRRWYNNIRDFDGTTMLRNLHFEAYNHHKWNGKSTWEAQYEGWGQLAGYVHLPGATSTTVSFRVALQFAMPTEKDKGLVPTLFVIACHNYHLFTGFRMDSALHSAHPHEQEILFQEGL